MRQSGRAIAVAGCILCLGAGQAAQNPPPQPPVFRTGVELVQVDVSVLDRDRRPVHGLDKTDFAVFEDGVRQEIFSFAEISVPEPPAVRTAWMRDVAPDVKTNAAGADRLIVLLLDDAHVKIDPRMMAAVREIGRRVIDRLGPSDLAAVVFTRDNSGAQPFTSDRARLLKALDKFVPGLERAEAARLSSTYFGRAALDTLRMVAGNLAQAHERRKAIVYVSSGVGVGADQFRLMDMQEILQNAQRGNVNVYCIDPTGLEALTDEMPDAADVAADPTDAAFFNRPNEFLYQLASSTGGFAIADRDEFGEGVTQIFRENGTYYLIGYQSSNSARDGKFRRIRIQMDRPGVTVRARSGYTATRENTRAKPETPATELLKALSAVAPERGVALQITAAPFAIAGKKEAAVAVVLTLRQPVASDAARIPELVDVVVGAYGIEGGRPAAAQRLTADAEVWRLGGLPLQYELLAQLTLKPGRYQLRVAARSPTEGKNGSIHLDVEVPDFSKAAVSLSGVVVAAMPSVLAAPRDRFASLLPVVPTARRDFRRADRASAFLRVYQRTKGTAAAIPITARIVNGAGAAAFKIAETIGADQFNAARAADYTIGLPVDQLTPGPYLLTIEAGMDKNIARRDVRFHVH